MVEKKATAVPEVVLNERMKERRRERARDRRLDLITKAVVWIVTATFIGLAATYGYFLYQQSKSTPVDMGAKNLMGLIKKNPDNADLRVRLGEYYLNKEYYDDAQQLFKEALRINPSHQRALLGLGLVYLERRQNDKAYEEFMKIIKISESAELSVLNVVLEQAHYYAGIVMMRENKYEKAIGHFRVALYVNPNSSDTHSQVGKAFIMLNKYDEAEKEFNEALKVDPVFAPALFGLGLVYEKTGQTQKAIEEYKKALKSEPNFKEASEALYRLTGM
jgi:superkiller protein 3